LSQRYGIYEARQKENGWFLGIKSEYFSGKSELKIAIKVLNKFSK